MFKRMLHTDQGRAAVNRLAAQVGLAVCGLFLLAGLGLAGDYGRGVDEVVQRDAVTANLRYILGLADSVEPARSYDRFYGVALELPLLLAEGALGLEDYYDVHRLRLTATHLLFLVGGFFCYLLAYRLFNSRLLALFALLLFLLHPRIYAHSFINPKDVPFLSMLVIALYLAERAFRKDTAGAFLLLGIAAGLLVNLRIMGLLLFAAVIGLRVLDGGLAKGWGERRGIVVAGGLFALAAGLVWYGVTPNAWGGPLAHLVEELSLTTNYPAIYTELFQGEIVPTNELPAHYGLTWFMITTPAAVLLLGAVGIAIAAARGLARPGAVWGNGRLRFWWLLAGCFGLPLLGVALAGSSIYTGWRHLYFVYVPFGLLAVGGLYWIAAALAGRRWRRAGVYGVLGLGLGLTLLQMAQLHPLQHFYFNFLADRSGTGSPMSRYQLEYWHTTAYDGLRRLLRRHPGERLAVYGEWGDPMPPLPREERRRLVVNSPVHAADYAVILMSRGYEDGRLADFFLNSEYAPVYNSYILSLRGLAAFRMDGGTAAGYEELYREAVAGEPLIRGKYAVYRKGRRLTFVKEGCAPGEGTGWFGAKVYPAAGALASGGVPELHTYKFIGSLGIRLGDKCLATIRLPDRPVAHLTVGQYRAARPAAGVRYDGRDRDIIWEGAHSFISPGLRAAAARLGANRPGITGEAGFEVYQQEGTFIYYREGCTARDTAARFFLHIIPEDAGDLAAARRGYGFETIDFYFGRWGTRFDGQCLATVDLPGYAIAGIRTGQEGYWEFRGHPPVEPGFLRERAAALAGMEPDYRGEFDLYWRDGELIYRRESCAAADTAAGFFLHITPVDGDDLAAARREYGFEGRDFEFSKWGGHFDGRCVAIVPLPGYGIASIRAGQYVAGLGEVWSAELKPP